METNRDHLSRHKRTLRHIELLDAINARSEQQKIQKKRINLKRYKDII